MKLSIRKGSENYAAQIIALPPMLPVTGLDNLVQVTHLGNNCLVQKNSDPAAKYLFFPAGAVLDPRYLANNNLYRHSQNNLDSSKSGFFEDSGRVKSIRFKGVISTGFIIPAESLSFLIDPALLKAGDSFTDVNDKPVCWKYTRPQRGFSSGEIKDRFNIETLVDPKFAPEHTDTSQLLKNSDRFTPDSNITITHKLHGTSIRVFHTRTKRKLTFLEKCLKALGIKLNEHQFSYLVGSRRVIKSRNFTSLKDRKQPLFKDDLWSKVARSNLKDKLYQGEAVYGEIVGTDYAGAAIQLDYTYGFPSPKFFIYRITQINPEGIEIDLSWHQVKQRASQLGMDTVPELYTGRLGDLLKDHQISLPVTGEEPNLLPALEQLFHGKLLDQPSVLDHLVVEEGFVVRQDTYPKVTSYKIKSRKFLLHESKLQDKEIADMEEDN